MTRVFDKNMFVMLLTIMIGVVIITYFIGDIVSRSKIETLTKGYESDITTIKAESENFTSHFIKSSVILDQAREDRAFGNYHFDLGFLWYTSALAERNETNFELYKTRGIDNCTHAMPYYTYSNLNFIDANEYFKTTKGFTKAQKYHEILDKYVALTSKGAELMLLRYNASLYLKYILENVTYNPEIGGVEYLTNVTDLLDLFNHTMLLYSQVLSEYQEIQNDIDGYEFFDEIR